MGMSGTYGAVDDDEGLPMIRADLDAGVTLIDTGDFYGSGHNEMLIGRACGTSTATTSCSRSSSAPGARPTARCGGIDTRPASMRNFLAYSLQRLGTDYLDIYRPARLDPAVPIEDTVGAIAELVEEGYVRHVGLSEVGPETIRRAAAVHPIVDLQIEYSLMQRGIEAEILPTVPRARHRDHRLRRAVAGLIGGSGSREGGRRITPRFADGNREHNEALVARLAYMAERQGLPRSRS